MKTRIAAIVAFLITAISVPALAQDKATVTSPDGTIAVSVMTDGEGHLQYQVTKSGRELVAPSRLGFQFSDANPMSRGFEIDGSDNSSTNTSWTLPWGERSTVIDHHNELVVRAHDMGGAIGAARREITLRFRVFDGGMGFRTEFPAKNDNASWNIADENTEFVIAQSGTAWWIPAGDWNRYEYLYNKTPIDGVSAAHTPMTMKLADGTHLSFHEAALVDYSGMWIKRIDGRRFRSTLAPAAKGPRVSRSGAFTTPWRTIRISDDAPGLYNADLELNLNEPNKLGDTSTWVKPYKYVGVWWEMHLDTASWASGDKHGATTKNTKRYIDFAARHGFRGVLVEGWNEGWDGNWFANGREFSFTKPYPDFDMKGVSAYGLEKGVHLVGHHETGGNIKNYEAQLEPAMKLYQSLGIDSVKTGYVADAGGIIAAGATPDAETFIWHDSQAMARHHLKVVETAAKYKIAVNPHEPIKDTGLRRTYPNWVSREGARGAEYDAWGVPGNVPSHVPNLVFTRMLSGPFDYTPGVVSLKGRDGRDLPSTLARQLALYLVIYSPIQMAADLPENYDKKPDALEFIKIVPVDWSKTQMLSGAVGEYAVIARKDKASEDWYVGGVTDEAARATKINLSFLPAGKKYRAQIWRDASDAHFAKETRHNMDVKSMEVMPGQDIDVMMAPGGGFAMRLTPLN